MSDEWADVFAAAEGRASSDEGSSVENPAKKRKTDEQGKTDKPRRVKGPESVIFRSYLEDRMRNLVSPRLVEQSCGMTLKRCTTHPCKRFMHPQIDEAFDEEKHDLTWEEKVKERSKPVVYRCTSCNQLPCNHVMTISDYVGKTGDDSVTWHVKLFCHVRNLRCVCMGCILHDSDKVYSTTANADTKLIKKFKKDYINAVKDIAKKLGRYRAHMEQQSDEHFKHLLQEFTKLHVLAKKSNSNRLDTQTLVRIVIACDETYYRLYYLQLTFAIPFSAKCQIPHPSAYFALSCSKVDNLHQVRMSDPLETIYTLRKDETREIFRLSELQKLWTVDTRWLKTPAKKDEHETPAIPIMMEWRNSCRDFMCHLYAYATIGTYASILIQSITMKKFAQVDGIIEIGSGTGYVARMLQSSGYRINYAYDCAPTTVSSKTRTVMNEYHGETPPFYNVRAGKAATILRLPQDTVSKSALLLCYPPPKSPMAYDSLKNYIDRGGQVLIHVGEFKGLTGSTAFETLLVAKFHCINRYKCQSWGTDAAYTTVWAIDGHASLSNHRDANKLLLPCKRCEKKESEKRLRIARRYTYCSKKCYTAGLNSLNEDLERCSHIYYKLEADMYDDKKYFQSL